MAAFTAQTLDTQWTTSSQIVSYSSPQTFKVLVISTDALVDPTVASPADAYTQD